MFKRFIIAASLLLAACHTPIDPPPPIKPPVHVITVHVFDNDPALDHKVPGAQISVEGCQKPECSGVADGAGNLDLTLPAGSYTVCGAFEGKHRDCQIAYAPGSVNLVLLPVAPPAPPTPQLRVDGRFWVSDLGTFRPVFASDLAPLMLSPEDQDRKLDETAALGFNGVRVFAGDLGWANQTPAKALAALPRFIEAAAKRGLYVYISALQGGGYDIEGHLRAVANVVSQHPNAVLEVANEVGHPSQSDIGKDPVRLLALARKVIPGNVVWSLGSSGDEVDQNGVYATAGGSFNTAHLDRGRPGWEQVRRLREIANISETYKSPAMSGEPIGSAEVSQPGRRLHDPVFFWTMGVLCRGFELGCVFHSEDGLNGRLLGTNQAEDARAFIAGTKVIPTGNRLWFQNAGWATSPVRAADFNAIVRAYSFLDGNTGYTVLIGITGDPKLELREGWRVVRTVDERPGIRVLVISR